MSERTDDSTHSDYRWTDHEAELHRHRLKEQSGSSGNQFSPPQTRRSNTVVNGSDETYDINADANSVLGPVALSPALLDLFDRNKNPGFYGQRNAVEQEEQRFTPAPVNLLDVEARGKGTQYDGQYKVPDLPPGVDLDANVKEAQRMYNPFTFVEKVQTGGDWDFKQYNKNTVQSPYEAGGNFHFGVTSKAFGFPEWLSKRAAGAYQIGQNNSDPKWGGPEQLTLGDKTKWPDGLLYKYKGVLSYPYGDDPADQHNIEQGFQYHDDHYNEGVDHTTRE